MANSSTTNMGEIKPFNEKEESFYLWKMRLDFFMEANNVANEKKPAVFMSCLGPKNFGILIDLLQPEKPVGKSYEDLAAILENHYQPHRIIVTERYKFYSRAQLEGETISEYATQLKHLAASCNFGNFLGEALRDRLICGLKNSSIRQRLLEADKPFSEILQRALTLEQVEKENKRLTPKENPFRKTEVVSQVSSFKKSEGLRTQKIPGQQKITEGMQECSRCKGRGHAAQDCPYKTYKCRKCAKTGHLAKACKTRGKVRVVEQRTDQIEEREPDTPSDTTCEGNLLFGVTENKFRKAYKMTLFVEDEPLEMVIDSGAVVTIVPEGLYVQRFSNVSLQPTKLSLQLYGGQPLPLLGEVLVRVRYLNKQRELRMAVAKGLGKESPPLLGREWLEALEIHWAGKSSTSVSTVEHPLEDLKQRFAQVFEPATGEIRKFEVSLVLREPSHPVFCKARPVPLAFQDRVSEELDKMVKQGILKAVRHSEWATPLVIVPKANGQLRLCADFKVTVNPQLKTEHYPLPSVEDMFTTVSGGAVFSVLDLSSAYLQLRVAADSQKYLTINTHKGLFQFTRLCYGISAAPMLFQSVMDRVLQGIPNCMCYLDDILIASASEQEGIDRLRMVFERLQSYGIRVNESKCQLLTTSVKYLGHCIDAKGIHPTEEKTKAIREAPVPKDVTQLKAYLGLVNYYGKYVPHLSTILQPLYQLTQKDAQWNWDEKCLKAFETSKSELSSNKVLTPYNSNLPLTLACDASSVGVGAVLSHTMEDGSERPIFYASRTLSEAERNYSNIEREALAIMFGVKKFHKYLYGRKFSLLTDHKPLIAIFNPARGVPQMAAARLQRWAIALSAYNYEVVYKKGSDITNADGLSRLPLLDEEPDTVDTVFYFSPVNRIPLSHYDVRSETRKDKTLSKALLITQEGWPDHLESEDLRPYFYKRHELSVDDGCLLWGLRVVVPESLRPEIMKMLHEQHTGGSRMKAMARSYVWWPGIDEHIEQAARECEICQSTQNAKPPVALQPWPYPVKKWERVHLDFAQVKDAHFLIVVDAYSKWPEIRRTKDLAAETTIENVRSIFAAHGVPHTLVTDNGSQLISQDFEEFLEKNGVRHLCTPPYHPESNGQVENMVQTFKRNLIRQVLEDETRNDPRTLQHKIDNFLFAYRITPHSATGLSPAEMLFGRRLRSRFDLLKPNLTERMTDHQTRTKERRDAERRKQTLYSLGEVVLVNITKRARRNARKWVRGTVVKIISPVLYKVKMNNNTIKVVHADHLRNF